jgi:hypothetical protein
MSSPPSVCPELAHSLGWTWDYHRRKYVDPRVFPNILDVQIDTLSRLRYYSIDTLFTEPTATRKPLARKAKQKAPSTPVESVTFFDFELPPEQSSFNKCHHTEETPTKLHLNPRESHKHRGLERKETLKQRRQSYFPGQALYHPPEVHAPE